MHLRRRILQRDGSLFRFKGCHRFSAITRRGRLGEEDEASRKSLTCGPHGESRAQPVPPVALVGRAWIGCAG
jgi:hypothetical protein